MFINNNRNRLSIGVLLIIACTLITYRFYHSEFFGNKPIQVTTWDAFGYYMYLPAVFIYKDIKKVAWVEGIDSTYSLTGGQIYQLSRLDNGNRVGKYLGGVAIMQLPFFFVGHLSAKITSHKEDGFSSPYQMAIAFGAIFYCVLSFVVLRRLLLRFFNDTVVAWCLLLLYSATNLIHYIATYAGGMSHAFILPLYVAIMYLTMKWHSRPKMIWAALIGFVIGLATICRPTEIIMLFIPLLWDTQTKDVARSKWNLVRKNMSHLYASIGFAILGILPQLIYWKIVTGTFVFDVGSKWRFLDPYFRVLFGFENGWFVYTPVTILFVAGLFFIRMFPFYKSVLVFCLLNIWIVISWSDWHYGATYSTRALIQSYPVFALSFAAVLELMMQGRIKYLYYLLFVYLIAANQFQLFQYDKGIIHYRDMNLAYYRRVYLNPSPTPVDMSYLDGNSSPSHADDFYQSHNLLDKSQLYFNCEKDTVGLLAELEVGIDPDKSSLEGESWIKIISRIKVHEGSGMGYLNCTIESSQFSGQSRVRLASPIAKLREFNDYTFYIKVPSELITYRTKLFITCETKMRGECESLTAIQLY